MMINGPEQERLLDKQWKKWGPYVSNRQWGTVREDYSENGDAWNYITHEIARKKAYRWGEEGIAGISDDQQMLCFSFALWNGKDHILKERLYGLTSHEGNHGEDVKEVYYYLDHSPTHSYMKMLYKYPQKEFPYNQLIAENRARTKEEKEFELIDTGIFDKNEYFDVFIEYAKADVQDILIKITVANRNTKSAEINILPTLWFRNTWDWGYEVLKPELKKTDNCKLLVSHPQLGQLCFYSNENAEVLFCDNSTNPDLYNRTADGYFKDGINNYVVNKNKKAVNPQNTGTKAALNYKVSVDGGASKTLIFRLSADGNEQPFSDFDDIFNQRIAETNDFYAQLQKDIHDDEKKMVQRQAFAGMLWNKQFYYYDITQWINGDPVWINNNHNRDFGRNAHWMHFNSADIIGMPDKWEYPWFAAWDHAFHCITYAVFDGDFAKKQLELLTKEWYMHPNGQLPAYEWNFNDVNPPVHAYAAFRVFKIDEKNMGKPDLDFLEGIFHKLIINFTWWVNRKDAEGNNIFEGGFLGLDNIALFDRSAPTPDGGKLEQADATSWMAMYSLNLMRIALELAIYKPVYQNMATKFFEHFLYIAEAISNMGKNHEGLWDNEDEFYYDSLRMKDDKLVKLKVRSMVGLIPLFAVEVINHEILQQLPDFAERLRWFLNYRPDLSKLVAKWQENNEEKHLLSLLGGHRIKRILFRMLDENEFLSDYGIRAVSKYHEKNPYEYFVDGKRYAVNYVPGESDSDLFGGNSNWRGPVWMPMNFLIVESLRHFHFYYKEDFKVECPTGSGNYADLNQIADELTRRLSSLFLKDENGRRPIYGDYEKFQSDPFFKDYILFFEYFHGDNGRGLGASHQTGWTGLIAKLMQPPRE